MRPKVRKFGDVVLAVGTPYRDVLAMFIGVDRDTLPGRRRDGQYLLILADPVMHDEGVVTSTDTSGWEVIA